MGLFGRNRSAPDAASLRETLPEVTTISEVVARSEVTVRGTVSHINAVLRGGVSSLAVSVDDGSGTVAVLSIAGSILVPDGRDVQVQDLVP